MNFTDAADKSIEASALISALENTSVYYFKYNVQDNIVYIPDNVCKKFSCGAVYENMPNSFADDFVCPEDFPVFFEMYEKIRCGTKTANSLFRDKSGTSWCHVSITAVKWDENGSPLEAVGIIEDVSDKMNRETGYTTWLNALGKMYCIRCYVNIADGSYSIPENSLSLFRPFPEKGRTEDAVAFFAENLVFEDDRPEFLNKMKKSYVAAHLNNENKSFCIEYRQIDVSGCWRWARGTLVLVDTLPDGTAHHAIFTVQYIDEEIEKRSLLESSIDLMRDTYYRIACIDLNANSMKTVSVSKSEYDEIPLFKEDYSKAIRSFAEGHVLSEYREKFLNVMLPERIKAIFDAGSEYVDLTYRKMKNGSPKWARTELIPLQGYSKDYRRIMWYVKNISDEKALEDKLSQKLLQINNDMNIKLETVLDGISGGFKISRDDKLFSYYYVSESAAALFGYTIDEFTEVTGNSAANNVYPPDRENAMRELNKCLAAGGSYSIKYRVKCKNGTIKWIVDSGKKIKIESGETLFYSLYQDVTEIEQRNADLNDALTMINRIVNSLSCGILSYRLPTRKILVFNEETKRLLGCEGQKTSEININKVLHESILPEDSAKVSRAVANLKNPGDGAAYQFRIKHERGFYTVQAISRIHEFSDGSRFVLSSMLDITEQSELNSKLREERKQYRDALLTNCEYAYSLDLTDGMITEEFVTKHGVNLFRRLDLQTPISFDEFNKKWIESMKPRFLDATMTGKISREYLLNNYSKGIRSNEVEYYSEAADTYTRITSLLSQSELNGHVMAVIVGTDTTENRKREAQTKKALMEAYDAAKRANSAKSDFLSRMSHDIRTPMNAIIGMTAIAGIHLDDKEKVSDCLNKITVSSSHLLSLINEILDMSKIESGKVDLSEEEFNLSDLIDNIVSMVHPQTKAKGQTLKVHINDVRHEKVIGDKLRIQQSFLNLMSNAVKYTPEGGTINLYISELKNNQPKLGRFEFIFEDTGIGMDPEFVKHIFEPFSRASDSRVSKEQGTGLGLAITDNLVRMMNGSIKVESELGKGSRFTVTMSLKLQNTEEISYSEFANLPVLVADDEKSTCETACQMLNEIGMKSEWVTSGKEAVIKVAERHNENDDYFAVILDWKMPDLDGIQATKEIRRLVGSDVPIIIISAYDWSDIELEARAAGADAFISKPLFKTRLAHVFHDIISGEDEKTTDSGAEKLMKEDFSGMRVLLVEDNELNAEIAQELLEMTGLEVECAENGQEAVDMFSASENGYYNIIFMDIQMPVMNGNEAARVIRSLRRRDARGVPIVAMTANAFSEDVQASMNAGMNQHIAKPLDLNQLVKVIKKWLY